MSHYRLYLLDDHDHITRGLDLSCRDDLDAKSAAEMYRAAHAVELWQGPRLVGRLEKQLPWSRAA